MSARTKIVPLVLLLAAAAQGCNKPRTKVSQVQVREASTDGVTQVEIRNTTGTVDVLGSRSLQPRFKVTAKLWAEGPGKEAAQEALKKVQLRVHRVGDKAIVLIKHPASKGKTRFGADLRLEVPMDLALDVDNRNGQVRILGRAGPLTVRTATGRIEARGIRRRIAASTTDGDIVVSGEVPSFELSTGKGKVELHVRALKRLEDASSVKTGQGDILVSLHREFDAQLSITGKGPISVPFAGLKQEGSSRTGAIGKGGKLLSLQAGKGAIRVLAMSYTEMRFYERERLGGKKRRKRKTHGHGHGHGHGHRH